MTQLRHWVSHAATSAGLLVTVAAVGGSRENVYGPGDPSKSAFRHTDRYRVLIFDIRSSGVRMSGRAFGDGECLFDGERVDLDGGGVVWVVRDVGD